MLNADRYFSPIPAVREIARELYQLAAAIPLVCPHGHVDPRLLALDEPFPDPADADRDPRPLHGPDAVLAGRADGVARDPARGRRADRDRSPADLAAVRRSLPPVSWNAQRRVAVARVRRRLRHHRAADRRVGHADLRPRFEACLARPEFRPRALFERFSIEVLCTTDAATDTLEWHQHIRESGWTGVVRPTFRPDLAINLRHPNWQAEIGRLGAQTGREITLVRPLHPGPRAAPAVLQADGRHGNRSRRRDALHGRAVASPTPTRSSSARWQAEPHPRTCARFTGHMLIEMARMSVDDGLVMQLHPGSDRNHNQQVFERFGPDRAATSRWRPSTRAT